MNHRLCFLGVSASHQGASDSEPKAPNPSEPAETAVGEIESVAAVETADGPGGEKVVLLNSKDQKDDEEAGGDDEEGEEEDEQIPDQVVEEEADPREID